MTILIIPDTNVLFSDPFLEGAQVKTILAVEDHTDIRLSIPELVIDELRNHIEKRLASTVNRADKLRRDYATLSGLNPHLIDIRISQDQREIVLSRFEERIQQLTDEGRVLGYPAPSSRELAQRSIRGTPPFQDKDRGMRDTLLWFTAKNCVAQGTYAGGQIALVTEDKAFWDESKLKMNESLIRELNDSGLPVDSITVWRSLQDVIESFASRLPNAESVEVAIAAGKIEDFNASSDTVLLEVTDWILDHTEILEVGDYLYVELDIVEEAKLKKINRTLDLGAGEVLVESTWTCEVAAEGFDSPYYSTNLRVNLQFELNSIVTMEDDCLSAGLHEITDVEVVSVVPDTIC